MSCLYILEFNILSVVSLTNIFSRSEGCLFILFMVSFVMQSLLSLIRSHLFIFSYCSWGSQGKNTEVVCHSLFLWSCMDVRVGL